MNLLPGSFTIECKVPLVDTDKRSETLFQFGSLNWEVFSNLFSETNQGEPNDDCWHARTILADAEDILKATHNIFDRTVLEDTERLLFVQKSVLIHSVVFFQLSNHLIDIGNESFDASQRLPSSVHRFKQIQSRVFVSGNNCDVYAFCKEIKEGKYIQRRCTESF